MGQRPLIASTLFYRGVLAEYRIRSILGGLQLAINVSQVVIDSGIKALIGARTHGSSRIAPRTYHRHSQRYAGAPALWLQSVAHFWRTTARLMENTAAAAADGDNHSVDRRHIVAYR